MPGIFSKPSSVIRWLTVVVVGCAVLETVQPMNAAGSSPPAGARSPDTVLYPKESPSRPAGTGESGERGDRSWMLAGVFLLAMGGAWLLMRRRGLSPARAVRPGRLLVVEETKSLGNRQYLVVAACEGRRFLLGVTPGRIQRIASLDTPEDEFADEADEP